jgi:hypothetical protein
MNRGADPLVRSRRPRRPVATEERVQGDPRRPGGLAPQIPQHSRYWEKYVALDWRTCPYTSTVNVVTGASPLRGCNVKVALGADGGFPGLVRRVQAR